MRISDILFICVVLAVGSTHALVAPTIRPLNSVPSTAALDELKKLERDVEIVVKKLRPTESDPSIGGTFARIHVCVVPCTSACRWRIERAHIISVVVVTTQVSFVDAN